MPPIRSLRRPVPHAALALALLALAVGLGCGSDPAHRPPPANETPDASVYGATSSALTATVTVCLTSASYGNAARFANARLLLDNAAYFGPTGTYVAYTFTYKSITSPFTEATLLSNGCRIWFSGFDPQSTWQSNGNLLALRNWWRNANGDADSTNDVFVLAGCDSSTNDAACEALGYASTTSTDAAVVFVDLADAQNPLTCGGMTTVDMQGGAGGYFATSGNPPFVTLGTNGGFPALILDSLEKPRCILTGDINLWAQNSFITTDGVVNTNEDQFVVNTFKMAADVVTGATAIYCGATRPPCATNNGGCSSNATCTNADAGALCACKSGFVGDGDVLERPLRHEQRRLQLQRDVRARRRRRELHMQRRLLRRRRHVLERPLRHEQRRLQRQRDVRARRRRRELHMQRGLHRRRSHLRRRRRVPREQRRLQRECRVYEHAGLSYVRLQRGLHRRRRHVYRRRRVPHEQRRLQRQRRMHEHARLAHLRLQRRLHGERPHLRRRR
jgi:hypothetical protein